MQAYRIGSITVVSFLTAAGVYYLYRQKQRRIPKDWIEVGNVAELFIYPLKSGRRIEIQSAECSPFGLVWTEHDLTLRDRSFVVYGESNNEFKTARTFPKLMLIKVSVINKDHLLFEVPNQNPLTLQIPDTKSSTRTISLHCGEKITTIDCGQEAAEWISKYLEKENGFRIGYHDGVFTRDITKTEKNMTKAYKKIGNEDMGMYSDLSGYLLINKASVDRLNTELEVPVTPNNFRPNILVDGDKCQPFSEEEWDYIKIGNVVFRNVKPCTRCVMTTIDPEEAVRATSRDPLKTLEKFNILKDPLHLKYDGQAPVMGINLGLKMAGSIKVGDAVYVSKQ